MSCNNCGMRYGCSCNCRPSGQMPYYQTDPSLQKNNGCKEKIYIANFQPVLRVQGQWAVPLADEIVSIQIAALADIMIGSILWNPDYGAYLIVAYDDNDLIKVVKTGSNSVANGTPIPPCTKFVVTTPPDIAATLYREFEASWTEGTGAGTLATDFEANQYEVVGDTVHASLNNELVISGGTLDYVEFELPFQPAPNTGYGQKVSCVIELAGTGAFPGYILLDSSVAVGKVYRTDGTALAVGNWIIQQNFFYRKGT